MLITMQKSDLSYLWPISRNEFSKFYFRLSDKWCDNVPSNLTRSPDKFYTIYVIFIDLFTFFYYFFKYTWTKMNCFFNIWSHFTRASWRLVVTAPKLSEHWQLAVSPCSSSCFSWSLRSTPFWWHVIQRCPRKIKQSRKKSRKKIL